MKQECRDIKIKNRIIIDLDEKVIFEHALKEAGNLLFISPSGWIRNQARAPMRNDLNANHGIVSLWDFRYHQVFLGVSTYTCIAHIRKGERSIPTKTYYWIDGNFSNSCDLIKLHARWAIVNNKSDTSYSNQSLKLGDIAEIRVGIQTLTDKVFIAPVIQWESEYVTVALNDIPRRIETGAIRRILKASVRKDGKDKIERVAIYPYSETGKLLPEKEFAEVYPLAYSWLFENKDRLLGRDKGTFSPIKWNGYGCEVSIRSALGRKILTSTMNPEPNFQICNDPDTLSYSGYCVKPKINISLEDLINELNSPEMDQHIRMFVQHFVEDGSVMRNVTFGTSLFLQEFTLKMIEGRNFKERLLNAVQDSYQSYVDHGPRSNQKIKVLHGWIISELTDVLGKQYVIQGLSQSGGKEQKVPDKYYEKSVDIAISRDDLILGVVSVIIRTSTTTLYNS